MHSTPALNNRNHLVFFLFVIALFLGLSSPKLLANGMFMDGLMYAAISRNMANGLGDFWNPHLTYGLFPVFYEHPPLALGLESIWFRMFGDSILVERFYSLTTFVLSGIFIALIWKELTKNIRMAWIPLLFWVTISTVTWSCVNNMLENTMTVFVCLSAWLYLKSHKKQAFLFILLSGFALSLASLTKGFVCLYIWTLPFFYWLFFRRGDFFKMFFNSVLFILATALPIVFFYFFSDDANKYLTSYFTNQVTWNSQHQPTVSTRFAILGGFFQSVLPPVLIAVLIAGLAYIKKIPLALLRANYKTVLLYLCLTLSGVLPIMISLKQSNFYILTVFPFFVIALGILFLPIIERLVNIKGTRTDWFKPFTIIACCMLLISLTIAISRMNKIGRDNNKITDCYKIIETIGPDQLVNICPEIYSDWSLHGYFARYGNISLIPYTDTAYRYFLTSKSCNVPSPIEYKEMDLELKEYRLFIKK